MFKRLFFLSFPLSVFLSACDDIRYAQDTQWATEFFDENSDNFEKLGDALLADASFDAVYFCDENGEQGPCGIRVESVSDAEARLFKKYGPLVEPLNAPRPVYIDRMNENELRIAYILNATRQNYDLNGSYIVSSIVRDDIESCDGYEPRGLHFVCRIQLSEKWSLEWMGVNLNILSACGDYEIDTFEHDQCVADYEQR